MSHHHHHQNHSHYHEEDYDVDMSNVGSDTEEMQRRSLERDLRKLGINNVREQDLEISSQKVTFMQWIMFLVLYIRVGLNVTTIAINFKEVITHGRHPEELYNMSKFAQAWSEIGIIGLLFFVTTLTFISFLIARACCSRETEAYRKRWLGDTLRLHVYCLKWLASFSLLRFIPSVGALSDLPSDARNVHRRLTACCGGIDPTGQKSKADQDEACCVKCGRLTVLVLFVLIQFLLFGLGTVAFYVKVSQLAPLFVVDVNTWRYQEYITFFGFMNNIASLQDINEATSTAVLNMIFGGSDGNVSASEWQNQQTFLTNYIAMLVITKGFYSALALASAVSAKEMQQILIKEKSLKQHREAKHQLEQCGFTLPPPEPIKIETRPGDAPLKSAEKEAAERDAAEAALQAKREKEEARKDEIRTLRKVIANYTDEDVADPKNVTALSNIIRYNFLRADTDGSDSVSKKEAQVLFKKAESDGSFSKVYDEFDPHGNGVLDGPSFGRFMMRMIVDGFDWHVSAATGGEYYEDPPSAGAETVDEDDVELGTDEDF